MDSENTRATVRGFTPARLNAWELPNSTGTAFDPWRSALSASERRARRGVLAEQHVSTLIEERGWNIIDRNFRIRSGEIDLIAFDGDVLVFIEVRARTGTAFGLADDTVDQRKLEKITSTALTYIEQHPEFAEHYWRVDLFAITLGRGDRILACRQYENLTLS